MAPKEDVLALWEKVTARAPDAELHVRRLASSPVVFQAGALASARTAEITDVSLRVLAGGRVGYAVANDVAAGDELARNALAAAALSQPASFRFPAPGRYAEAKTFDAAVPALAIADLIRMGEEMVAVVAEYDAGLQVDVYLEPAWSEVDLLNASGAALGRRGTYFAAQLVATLAAEGNITMVGESAASRRLADVDYAGVARDVVARLRQYEKTTPCPTRAMPVVFRRGATFALLFPLILGFNGRNVLKGSSPLRGRLGERAFDPRLSIVDDGLLDYGAASAPFDDEGVPAGARPLVEEGFVRGFLYDLRTAAEAGAAPTGNGFKSANAGGANPNPPPGVAGTNWRVAPGDKPLAAILADLDEALVVDDLIGVGMGNVIGGEFSASVSTGVLYRRGEPVGRVKDAMVAGNVYELLRDRLIALDDHVESRDGELFVPAVVLDGVGVVGQG